MPISTKEWYRNVYLHSDAWKLIRTDVAVRFKGRCDTCGKEDIHNDAHHLWYDDLRYTNPEQFVFLCRTCHTLVHSVMEVQRCTTPRSQMNAITKYTKFRKAFQSELFKHTKPRIKSEKNDDSHIIRCFLCHGYHIPLTKYWMKKDLPITTDETKSGVTLCDGCLPILKEHFATSNFNKGSELWSCAKAFKIQHQLSKTPIDLGQMGASLLADSQSYIGIGI